MDTDYKIHTKLGPTRLASWRFCGLLLIFFLITNSHSADRRAVIDSVYLKNGIYLNFHIDNLIDEKAISALKRGITSEIISKVQLWQNKSLVSPIVTEKEYAVKVYYDNWDRKFAILTPDERLLTSSLETVTKYCTIITGLLLADSAHIEIDARYYISIRTIFQPISDESYFELRDWLEGKDNADQQEKQVQKKRGRLTDILLNLLGFGDKVIECKSKNFKITADGQIDFDQ